MSAGPFPRIGSGGWIGPQDVVVGHPDCKARLADKGRKVGAGQGRSPVSGRTIAALPVLTRLGHGSEASHIPAREWLRCGQPMSQGLSRWPEVALTSMGAGFDRTGARIK